MLEYLHFSQTPGFVHDDERMQDWLVRCFSVLLVSTH